MRIRNAVNPIPATTPKNKFTGSSSVRSFAAGCTMASGLLVAGCTEPPVEVAISEPDPDLVFVRGYRNPSDECQLVGESAFTVEFLDDASDLVACPTGSSAMETLMVETGAQMITQTNSLTFFSLTYR
ncbi:hypothetical protein [Aliiruegeria sabulilitoris]|uniref:hypothetical protein n=1 Tax=Aliiruegeria sabulilitoris TaxID=1510458 RepID=UPI0012E33530|nr:hypothetical protein [Aliiruegeria sabulilitoris]NDR57908.1 hypothetical protein [Pseudoruegeria sp. M32A2M]